MSWRTDEGTPRASSSGSASRRQLPSSRRTLPSSTQESTAFSRNSGLPPVRSSSARPTAAGSSAPGTRALRYSETASSPSASRSSRATRPLGARSATAACTGCARVAASAERRVATTSRRAGSRRRASADRRVTVEGSLQWRSSMASTIGRSVAADNSASTISRNIRAWVAPRMRPWTRERSPGETSHGICTIHVGARSTRSGTTPSAPGARLRPSRASRTGM